MLPEMIENNFIPDVLTDQTSAHDPLNGYIPVNMTLSEADELRKKDSQQYEKLDKQSIVTHVKAMLKMQEKGSVKFDYGNNIRQVFKNEVLDHAFDFLVFVLVYIYSYFFERNV